MPRTSDHNITCVCGSAFKLSDKSRHLKTSNKHRDWLATLSVEKYSPVNGQLNF